MDAIYTMLETRCNRANLDTAKSYIEVVTKNGVTTERKVGRFIRTYRMGSGDGMTMHWEFNLDGVIHTVEDSFFGTVGGEELVWYKECS